MMSGRRGSVTGPPARNRSGSYRGWVVILLALSVATPVATLFYRGRAGRSFGGTGAGNTLAEEPKANDALQQIEALFPQEVLEAVSQKAEEGSVSVPRAREDEQAVPDTTSQEGAGAGETQPQEEGASPVHLASNEEPSGEGETPDAGDPSRATRREERVTRRNKRLQELTSQNEEENDRVEKEAINKSKTRETGGNDGAMVGKYSIWRKDSDAENSDQLVRLMRDQLIMARGYIAIAQQNNNVRLVRELKMHMKDCQRALGEANTDAELPSSATERMRAMGQLLAKARDMHYDCTSMVKKLRAMVQTAEEQARMLKRQSTFLSQLAAKTIPKGLHCLSLRLSMEYHNLASEKRIFTQQDMLVDKSLYHYALFSDNILAASVVVNSTVGNAKDPSKHVFHIVTDRLNFASFKMWFLTNPPAPAAVEVMNVDDFKWLNSSYCPVLRQLESASMKEYYFKADKPQTMAAGSSNLKYRNPKYLSMLNHLRFYLPEVYPQLDKVLFLDDDIVVQKDLTGLWDVDLNGNVNGAVETCGASFHRFDKYLNFSNPLISDNFDPMACGWAYGMNMFDLVEWKKHDITGIYHGWQNKNEDRTLWKLGTLPPGLITFYNLTQPLDKSWHVLGLGYNPNLDMNEIDNAAVVHYNGNMKPWLEIGMTKFKSYWTKYVYYEHPYLQACNIND